MRRAKLYQLMAVAGGLGVAVASTPTLAKDLPSNPLNWAAGSAVVDGNIDDWGDLTAAPFNRMCEAGRLTTTGECDGKDQLSTLYARYDCDTDTMYLLVLKEDGHTADGQRWVKIYDLDNSEHDVEMADVVVDGVSQGYEASFALTGGTTYNEVEVHINIDGDNTSSTGKKNTDISIDVPVSCEMPKEDPTLACNDLVGTNGVSMSVIATYKADGNGGYSKDSGTGNITIDADGNPSVDGGTVDIATFIEDGVQDSDGIVSGNIIQFCQVPVFDSEGAEVCLWSADKDADGNYVNIEQVGCVDAEKGKFYAIEAAGEFSSTLAAE